MSVDRTALRDVHLIPGDGITPACGAEGYIVGTAGPAGVTCEACLAVLTNQTLEAAQ